MTETEMLIEVAKDEGRGRRDGDGHRYPGKTTAEMTRYIAKGTYL